MWLPVRRFKCFEITTRPWCAEITMSLVCQLTYSSVDVVTNMTDRECVVLLTVFLFKYSLGISKIPFIEIWNK